LNGKGAYDRAIADLDQALALNPNMAVGYRTRAIAYAGKGDHARAIADYDAALKLDPDLAGAREGRDRAQAALAAKR
jgi:tetratricopeptide (TPR) repeat protein